MTSLLICTQRQALHIREKDRIFRILALPISFACRSKCKEAEEGREYVHFNIRLCKLALARSCDSCILHRKKCGLNSKDEALAYIKLEKIESSSHECVAGLDSTGQIARWEAAWELQGSKCGEVCHCKLSASF